MKTQPDATGEIPTTQESNRRDQGPIHDDSNRSLSFRALLAKVPETLHIAAYLRSRGD